VEAQVRLRLCGLSSRSLHAAIFLLKAGGWFLCVCGLRLLWLQLTTDHPLPATHPTDPSPHKSYRLGNEINLVKCAKVKMQKQKQKQRENKGLPENPPKRKCYYDTLSHPTTQKTHPHPPPQMSRQTFVCCCSCNLSVN